METKYHVSINWDGGDLLSLYEQHGSAAYEIFADRWPDAGNLATIHAHVIHLWDEIEDALEYADYVGGDVLEIDTEDITLEWDTLEDSCHHYTAKRVPVEAIKIIHRPE